MGSTCFLSAWITHACETIKYHLVFIEILAQLFLLYPSNGHHCRECMVLLELNTQMRYPKSP